MGRFPWTASKFGAIAVLAAVGLLVQSGMAMGDAGDQDGTDAVGQSVGPVDNSAPAPPELPAPKPSNSTNRMPPPSAVTPNTNNQFGSAGVGGLVDQPFQMPPSGLGCDSVTSQGDLDRVLFNIEAMGEVLARSTSQSTQVELRQAVDSAWMGADSSGARQTCQAIEELYAAALATVPATGGGYGQRMVNLEVDGYLCPPGQAKPAECVARGRLLQNSDNPDQVNGLPRNAKVVWRYTITNTGQWGALQFQGGTVNVVNPTTGGPMWQCRPALDQDSGPDYAKELAGAYGLPKWLKATATAEFPSVPVLANDVVPHGYTASCLSPTASQPVESNAQ
ncbi:MAG: hypothetical protein FWD29_03970 [Micrococcales bacterium]|nr:hypothetical protein [Micrococcales bacterium]